MEEKDKDILTEDTTATSEGATSADKQIVAEVQTDAAEQSAGGATAKRSVKEKIKALDSANNTRWQAIKYFLCMCSAGVIQLVSSSILEAVLKAAAPDFATSTMTFITTTAKATFIASTIGLALSILWNFTLNRKFTFKSAKNVPVAMALAFLFYVPFYPFQIWFVDAVQFGLSPSGATWAFIIATGLVMILNGVLEFCWQKFFIYRKSTNTAVKKDEAATDAAPTADETEHNTENK